MTFAGGKLFFWGWNKSGREEEDFCGFKPSFVLQEELKRLREEMLMQEKKRRAEVEARAMQHRVAQSLSGAEASSSQNLQDAEARTLKVGLV